ncbi:MAG: ATP phosphoribosyltransferase [Dehalococcoidales bacterium]|nr:ATP phosphoribosyltransferase [Dehalococcoidales bacterium]
MINNSIKVALPKGRLLGETAALLQRADWGLSGYREGMRNYRLKSQRFPNLLAKVFHEKDIPIQVAVGNYDLGICGLDWIEELLVKYPSSALVKVKNLGYGEGALYMAAGRSGGASTVEEMQSKPGIVRIASEYPNLAESYALDLRLRRFSVFPLWGAAEVYPPESADLALISARAEELFNYDLVPVSKILGFSAYLIANKSSWETKDLSEILTSVDNKVLTTQKRSSLAKRMPEVAGRSLSKRPKKSSIFWGTRSEEVTEIVWLALPDGHHQLPTLRLLSKAGIQIDDYPSAVGNRRPTTNLAGVRLKVIRPQDMPMQVANGNFDLAITGRDWLMEHLYQFPSSPVKELLDLKFGKVKVVAVVSRDLSVVDVHSLRQLNAERLVPLRVASEYVNIADKYARDNHLGQYRVVPTWGASEAFLPEDADLLIENTQTGRTLARHNLKVIDTLFESTACLIGNSRCVSIPGKGERIRSITETLRTAVED